MTSGETKKIAGSFVHGNGFAVIACGALSVCLPNSALAQNVTNWATWVIPTDYPLPFTDDAGFYKTGADYTTGTTGTVIDPQSGQTIDMILSGEVAKYSTQLGFYPASQGYDSEVVGNPPSVDGSQVTQIAQTGFTLPEYQAHTLQFSAPVENAVMAIRSLGRGDLTGGFLFSQPFVVLSQNAAGFTSSGDSETGYSLTGNEAGGMIQFLGTYDTISWIAIPAEAASYFTIGLTTPDNPEAGNPAIVPYDLFADGTGITAPTSFGTFPGSGDGGTDPGTGGSGDGGGTTDVAAPPGSVLERVLARIDGATNHVPVTGVFANIAENIGGADGAGIDGSITNVVAGLAEGTRSVVATLDVSALNVVTVDLGDMSTTVLGAVNTGEITLGVNAGIDEATSGAARAVSAVVTQLGGGQDQGVLVLNVASNMAGVDGAIRNSMTAVNATIGNLATTTLGAVNTGAITSGTNAIVQGIVGL